MIIRNENKTVRVTSIIGDSLKRGGKSYPALRFEFTNEVTAEDIETLLSGTFEIINDNGEVLGTHEGYNTLKNISVVIGKVTTDEQHIEELEASLVAIQAEKDELQNAIDVMVGGNAE